MEYLQYHDLSVGSINDAVVLNLIINGIPSIHQDDIDFASEIASKF